MGGLIAVVDHLQKRLCFLLIQQVRLERFSDASLGGLALYSLVFQEVMLQYLPGSLGGVLEALNCGIFAKIFIVCN